MSIFIRLGVADYQQLCWITACFGSVCVSLFYFLIRMIFRDWRFAFSVALFFALTPAFLGISLLLMSEVPCLAFILLCLLMIQQKSDLPPLKDFRFWIVIFCVIAAYYIRSSAIAVVVAAFAVYLLRRQWRHAAILVTFFTAAIAPWIIRTHRLGGSTYLKQFLAKNPGRPHLGNASIPDFSDRVLANFHRDISSDIPSAVFRHFFPDLNGRQPTLGYSICGAIVVVAVLFGSFKLFRKAPAVVIYLLSSCGILMLWPDIWFGSRFLVPILPIICLTIFYPLHLLGKITFRSRPRIISWNPLVLGLISLVWIQPEIVVMRQDAEDDYEVKWSSYITAAQWAKAHVSKEAIVVTRKPEIFAYFSGLRCIGYQFDSSSRKLAKDLDEYDVGYVVLDELGFSSQELYLLPAMRAMEKAFVPVYRVGASQTWLLAYKSGNAALVKNCP